MSISNNNMCNKKLSCYQVSGIPRFSVGQLDFLHCIWHSCCLQRCESRNYCPVIWSPAKETYKTNQGFATVLVTFLTGFFLSYFSLTQSLPQSVFHSGGFIHTQQRRTTCPWSFSLSSISWFFQVPQTCNEGHLGWKTFAKKRGKAIVTQQE